MKTFLIKTISKLPSLEEIVLSPNNLDENNKYISEVLSKFNKLKLFILRLSEVSRLKI